MDRILENTHKHTNIDLLKIRDYYFDKARHLNKIKKFVLAIPPLSLALSYISIFDNHGFVSDYRDLWIGILTLVVYAALFIIDRQIDNNLKDSNAYREAYDCKVFEMQQNCFSESITTHDNSKVTDKEASEKVQDMDKYEVWYGEVFCNNNGSNVICSQMDNILYTYYAYKDMKKIYVLEGIACALAMLFLMFQTRGIINSILIVFAFFEIFSSIVEGYNDAREQLERNKELKKTVIENKDEILKNPEFYTRCLQDCVVANRRKSLFILKCIRKKHLLRDSSYHKSLNEVKAAYFNAEGNTVAAPSKAEDIKIVSMNDEFRYSMTDVQTRLKTMLKEITAILDEEGIEYVLDGGTLLGAVRIDGVKDRIRKTGGGFLFWDDDVDIAIKASESAKVAEILSSRLDRNRFVLQTMEQEQFYSPRLSSMRVRERNDISFIDEKDSPLYRKYQHRGLFIDIYAYSPILVNRTMDSLFRRLVIHPYNRKILKTERNWKIKSGVARQKEEAKFLNQKMRYLKAVNWYSRHARNTEYCSYLPYYINDLNQPGPYIRTTDIWGGNETAEWEGFACRIPAAPISVLSAMYGSGENGWYANPYKTIEELKEKYGDNTWFSEYKFNTTVLKHIRRLELY